MAFYKQAGEILSDAYAELGLGSLTDSNAYTSTDANVVQLRTLLKREGRRLARLRHWPQLVKEGTVTTANGTAQYALPTDCLSVIDGSMWNRTTQQPATPVNEQRWQAMKASGVTAAITVLFLPRGPVSGSESTQSGSIEIYPTPTATESIKFDYRSSDWTVLSSTFADAPASYDYVCLFDSLLLLAAVKLAWLKAKGFDTTAAQQDYDDALGLAAGNGEVAAPTLRLGPVSSDFGALTLGNVPETGYGS